MEQFAKMANDLARNMLAWLNVANGHFLRILLITEVVSTVHLVRPKYVLRTENIFR